MTLRFTSTAAPVMTMMAVPKKEKTRNLRSRKNVRAIKAVTTAPTANGSVNTAPPVMTSPSLEGHPV